MDYFGSSKTQLENLNPRQIKNLVFSAFVSYFVMLLCGTLGAPQQVAHIITSCADPYSCLTQGIQICETPSGTQALNELVSVGIALN